MPPARTEGERHPTLDGLRGVAVMGILLVNVTTFGHPDAAYLNPADLGARPIDTILWCLNIVLVDGKMRNLFSLLFGASLLLVIQRAEASGDSPARAHFARMGWLLVFGLLHFYFVWTGDILTQYAVVGMAAYFARKLGARTLFIAGVTLLTIQLLVTTGFGIWLLTLREAAAPGADPAAVADWYRHGAPFGLLNPDAVAREVARYQGGSYADLLAYRFSALLFTPARIIALAGTETLGMVLLGMAGLKSGFLTGAWQRTAYRRVARTCYAVGLPVMAALVGWCAASGFDTLECFVVVTGPSGLVRPVIMYGHAALAILWLTGGPSSVAVKRVAAAGRVAFTNYLATSIVMTSLFYGYGGALFARLGRAELFLLVLAAWAAMLAWSAPWLARFRFGPFEWAWRSLARGRLQPLRVAAA